MTDLAKKWKAHGDYACGYADAFNGLFDPDGADTEPYKAGWDAGMRAVKMFEEAGFSKGSDGLTINLAIGGKDD